VQLRRFQDVKRECERLQRVLDDTLQERDVLDQQLRAVVTELEAAQRQFTASDADRRDLRDLVAKLQAALEDKSACLTATRSERDRLLCERDTCASELERERVCHRETAHTLERCRLAEEAALHACAVAQASSDEHASRHSALVRDTEALTVEFTRSENCRDELEVDVETLRRDNEALVLRLDAAARERAALADKLNASLGGPSRPQLVAENARLVEQLAETAKLADELRGELMRRRADSDDSSRDLQRDCDLLRRTTEILQAEERQFQRFIGINRR
jgi:hypothetical protein